MPNVKLDGVDLYYEVHGQGFPLVLSHTGWVGTEAWANNTPVLAEKYQVIVYDRRGSNRSVLTDGSRMGRPWDKAAKGEIKPGAQSAVAWVWDLHRLLVHLGIERAYVGGSSDGCCVSLEFWFAHPDMVEAAILVGGNAFGFLHDRPGFGVAFPDRRYDLPSLKAPALFLHGEQDGMFPPAMGDAAHQLTPGSEMVVIPGTGHFPERDTPEAFNTAVLDFLARMDARRAGR